MMMNNMNNTNNNNNNNNNDTDNNCEPRRLCDGTTASPLLSRGERRRHNDSGHVCTLGERSC